MSRAQVPATETVTYSSSGYNTGVIPASGTYVSGTTYQSQPVVTQSNYISGGTTGYYGGNYPVATSTYQAAQSSYPVGTSSNYAYGANTGYAHKVVAEEIPVESRIQYIPFEKKYVEYEQVEKIYSVPYEREIVEYEEIVRNERIPVERTITDYYAVETQVEYIKREIEETIMVEEPVERVFERVQYIPVETQIVHYPERDNYVPAQTKVRTEYVGVQQGVTGSTVVQGGSSKVGGATYVSSGSGVRGGYSSGQYVSGYQGGNTVYQSGNTGYQSTGYQQVSYGQPTTTTTTQQVYYGQQPATTYVSNQPTTYVSSTREGGYVAGGSGVGGGYATGGSGVRTNQNTTYVSSGSGVKHQQSYETSYGYQQN